MKQEIIGWHQLDHMQIICTSLQTENHAGISSLNVYMPSAVPDTHPTLWSHWKHFIMNPIEKINLVCWAFWAVISVLHWPCLWVLYLMFEAFFTSKTIVVAWHWMMCRCAFKKLLLTACVWTYRRKCFSACCGTCLKSTDSFTSTRTKSFIRRPFSLAASLTRASLREYYTMHCMALLLLWFMQCLFCCLCWLSVTVSDRGTADARICSFSYALIAGKVSQTWGIVRCITADFHQIWHSCWNCRCNPCDKFFSKSGSMNTLQHCCCCCCSCCCCCC